MLAATQSNPIMIRVVETPPVEGTGVADDILGSIGLTGLLIIVALLAGGLLGGVLIGLKKLRERSGGPLSGAPPLKLS